MSVCAKLFEPTEIAGLQLKSRIVMSPMTRHFASDGLPHPDAGAYYARRARGGAGLIITEGVAIDHSVAALQKTIPVFHGEAALERWRGIVRDVHEVGGAIFPQLWHAGRSRVIDRAFNTELDSIAPSAEPDKRVRAMTDSDIADVIDAFGRSAAAARDIGCDGVAVHGGHGYLLDEFLWDQTNRRADRYAGSIAARVNFTAEIVAEIRRQVGSEMPIMLRLSQWKTGAYDARLAHNPQELEVLLAPLVDAGVDIFDASTRRFWLPEFEGSDLNLAGWMKKLTSRPTMTVGSVGLDGPLEASNIGEVKPVGATIAHLDTLEMMLERGDFDLVAIGRVLLANPEWPKLVADGSLEAIHTFDADRVRALLEPAVD
jgi:2,4-dienoyl-CoA reductase-like NADH-dependent reductase (Old Yellow Enzyme family)